MSGTVSQSPTRASSSASSSDPASSSSTGGSEGLSLATGQECHCPGPGHITATPQVRGPKARHKYRAGRRFRVRLHQSHRHRTPHPHCWHIASPTLTHRLWTLRKGSPAMSPVAGIPPATAPVPAQATPTLIQRSSNPAPYGWQLLTVRAGAVSYTHLRAHETGRNLVCRLLL